MWQNKRLLSDPFLATFLLLLLTAVVIHPSCGTGPRSLLEMKPLWVSVWITTNDDVCFQRKADFKYGICHCFCYYDSIAKINLFYIWR